VDDLSRLEIYRLKIQEEEREASKLLSESEHNSIRKIKFTTPKYISLIFKE
jgi:hypothetical protein